MDDQQSERRVLGRNLGIGRKRITSLNHIGGIYHIDGSQQYIESEYNTYKASCISTGVLPIAYEYTLCPHSLRVIWFHYALTSERAYIPPLDLEEVEKGDALASFFLSSGE